MDWEGRPCPFTRIKELIVAGRWQMAHTDMLENALGEERGNGT